MSGAADDTRRRSWRQRLSMSRERWANKPEFLLAAVGFAVDLGNIWRFPYVCYRLGGGAFLIPYMLMFIFGGLPLFYMELVLGQYHRSGCISVWKRVCPLFKGIGFGICFISIYIACFYNTIIAWAVYFFFNSFRLEVPWKTCNNSWNTKFCRDSFLPRQNESLSFDANISYNIVHSFALCGRQLLEVHKSHGFDAMGSIKGLLALCLLLVFVVVYFALFKGPRSYGKVVWITSTLPYIVLLVLLVRGVTLPGASKGISYYLTPQWDKLLETEVWIHAATQIFFSLGPGFGVLLALSSYNDFGNDCYTVALVTSVVNCLTSFLAGFVIFSTLGYMAELTNKHVSEVAGSGGLGLIFIVYPQAISTMTGSSVWAVLFFFMLITLGIGSTFGYLEALITGFCDEFPTTVGRKRELFVFGLIVFCYLGSLMTTTYGGSYLVEFLDHYGVSFSVLFIMLVETIAVCWLYCTKRFSEDIREMLGHYPNIYWRTCWKAISPIFIAVIFWVACSNLKQLTMDGNVYPRWSVYIGWTLCMSSMSCIPIYMFYKLAYLESGTLSERLSASIRPVERRSCYTAQRSFDPIDGGGAIVMETGLHRIVEE